MINVLGNTKEKIIKLILVIFENEAVNYIVEYDNNSLWNEIDTEKEYKCILIQDLIDREYFNTDLLNVEISNNRKVISNDIYC